MRLKKYQNFQPHNLPISFKLRESSDFLSELSELEPPEIIRENLKVLGNPEFLIPPTLSDKGKGGKGCTPLFSRTFIYFIYFFIIINNLVHLGVLIFYQNFPELSRTFV